MQKIIGLDIGSYSIKAVEILNHFKSYEISSFYEVKLSEQDLESSPDMAIPLALEKLFQTNQLTADRIVTAMPGQYTSSRIFPFGFSDANKIEAAVQSEMEEAVPFDLDAMIVDHQILNKVGDKTIVLAVMTKTSFVSSFLSHLQRVGIDPKLIDVDSLAFYNLCPYLSLEPGKCYAIVDLGHEKTSVCLVQDGVLRMMRAINLGGRYITEFLARDGELSFADAERLKHRVSAVVLENGECPSGLSEEDQKIAAKISIAMNSVIRELGRTLYAFKTWEKAPVEKIFISGGSSVIRNLDKLLTEQLEIPTIGSQLEQSHLSMNTDLLPKVPFMAQGIAIGLRAVTSVKRHSQINLRKGDFAFVQSYDNVMGVANLVGKIVGFVALLLGVSFGMKAFRYNSEINKLQGIFKKEIVQLMPDLKKKEKGAFEKFQKEGITALKERTASLLNAQEGFVEINQDSASLVALGKISEAVGKDIKVNVTEYFFNSKPDGSGLIRLTVEGDSFDTLDKFKLALKKIKALDEVQVKSSDSKPGSDLKVAVYETNFTVAK